MGRDQPAYVIRPNQNRRDERAKRARDMKNRDIPEMLRSSPRARHGIHKADLIVDPAPVRETPQNLPSRFPTSEIKIRVQCADTLSAAARISEKPCATKRTAPTLNPSGTTRPQKPNATILNMASQLRPGGGFLEGANSQEEFLCARTTLYPSLWDSFYRLPEISGIFTPDVLVFRDHLPEANELPKRDRFFVDVISAGMFKFADARAEGCSCGVSFCDRHRDLVARKMRAVLRIAQLKGVERLVLGAWGCGSGAGNPVPEMAKLWRKIIVGGPRQRRPNVERWEGIREIVFAIPDRTVVREFESAFGDVLAPPEEQQLAGTLSDEELEADPNQNSTMKSNTSADVTNNDPKSDEESAEISLLLSRIAETEMQLETAAHQPRARARLRHTLAVLQRDLAQGLAAKASRDEDISSAAEDDEEEADGFVVAGFHRHSENGEDENGEFEDEDTVASGGFYHFDEDDVASDSSSSAGSGSELYEFRAPAPLLPPSSQQSQNQGAKHNPNQNQRSHRGSFAHRDMDGTGIDNNDGTAGTALSAAHQGFAPSPRFDPSTGWFAGSMDQLSTLLRGGVVDGMSLNGDVPSPDLDGHGDGISAIGGEMVNGKVSHASPVGSPTVVRPQSKSGIVGLEIDEVTLRSYLRRYKGTDGGSD